MAHIGRLRRDSANGVDRTICGLVDHLPDENIDVEIWYLDKRSDRIILEDNVYHLPCHTSKRQLFGLPRITEAFLQRRTSQVDIVHFHSVFIPHHIHIASQARKYVLTPHGGYMPAVLSGRNSLSKKVWLAWKERAFVQKASGLHAVSSLEETQLNRLFSHRRVLLAPNATDVPSGANEALNQRFSVPWNFSFLGRIAIDQKGLDLLIAGYAAAAQRVQIPRLTLVGEDFRNGTSLLRAAIAKEGLNDCVSISPAIFGDDKDAFFRKCGVFVHTSRWEGLPFSLLEAMAWGCPVLVTTGTNIAKDVEHFEAGWVCPTSSEGIASALLNINSLSSDELARRGRRAMELIQTKYSWKKTSMQLADFYRECLSNSQ